MKRRLLAHTLGAATLAMLAGCAGLQQLGADVASFGEWPAGRAPGTYAFDRLPSQQARGDAQQMIEAAARPALAQAGFQPAAAGAQPDVLVQLGVRVSRSDLAPWDDPFWWRGGFGTWRHNPWRGPAWNAAWRYPSPRYDHDAALLIRDRASGQPLYEARASTEGFSDLIGGNLGALFRAAMSGFPAAQPQPRSVTVPLTTPP